MTAGHKRKMKAKMHKTFEGDDSGNLSDQSSDDEETKCIDNNTTSDSDIDQSGDEVADNDQSGDEVAAKVVDANSESDFDDEGEANVQSGNEDETDQEENGEDFSDNAMIIDFNNIPSDLKVSAGDKIVSQSVQDDDENDDGVDTFAHSKADDTRKGVATKSHLAILDKLLESRIRIQKSLQLSNRLPQCDKMKDFRVHSSPQIKKSYDAAKASLLNVMNQMLTLQDLLLDTNKETKFLLTSSAKKKHNVSDDEEIKSDSEEEDEDVNNDAEVETNSNPLNLPSKRKHILSMQDYEEEITKRNKAIKTFRDATITKWYEKTRLTSGKINKNFNSFDKSALQQINQVLSDKERLIKRTQLKRSPYTILGETAEVSEKNQDVDPHLKDYNENIFDDGDFYHEMLKELIERKSNVNTDDPVAASRQWLELQKLRSKIKRKIDTRASKGRKVRYDVHSKLVSFMAPQNVGSMSDQAR